MWILYTQIYDTHTIYTQATYTYTIYTNSTTPPLTCNRNLSTHKANLHLLLEPIMTHVHEVHEPHRVSTCSPVYHTGCTHLPFASTSISSQQSQTAHHTAHPISFFVSLQVTHTSHPFLKICSFSLSLREASKDKQIILIFFFFCPHC